MTLRPLLPSDAEAALALWNRSAPLDRVAPAVFHEKVWGPPAGLALAADDGDRQLVGIGVGVLWPTPDEVRGSVRLLAVVPEARRRGVGSRLLAALEGSLQQQGASVVRIGEAAPNYLTPGIDVRNEAGLAFVEALGYRSIGEAVNLGVDLAAKDWSAEEAERRLEAADVTVRRAAAPDRPALHALLDANWPAWQAETERALVNDPPSLHLALRDGNVLGFAAFDANNVGTGWFGPMGTDPAARGLGVGAVLLRRCLHDLRQQGRDHATIAWAAALPFYERAAGATVERQFRRVEKQLG